MNPDINSLEFFYCCSLYSAYVGNTNLSLVIQNKKTNLILYKVAVEKSSSMWYPKCWLEDWYVKNIGTSFFLKTTVKSFIQYNNQNSACIEAS